MTFLIQVLLISMVLSLIFKKDVDHYEHEENYGEMQDWFDIYSDKGKYVCKCIKESIHKVMTSTQSTMFQCVYCQKWNRSYLSQNYS